MFFKTKKRMECVTLYFIKKIGLFLYIKHKTNKISCHKILIIRLDEVGDVIMTTPLFREIRKQYPKSIVDLVVNKQTYDIVRSCPYLNNVFFYDIKKAKETFYSKIMNLFLFCKNKFIKKEYDIVIVPRWDVDYYNAGLMAFFSGSKRRLAYSENVNEDKAKQNREYDEFYTEVIDSKELKHEVERNMYFMDYLGIEAKNNKLEVWIDEKVQQWEIAFFNNLRKEHAILVALVPSAKDPRRIWKCENFIELISMMLDQNPHLKIVTLGGADACEAGLKIQTKFLMNVIDMTGKTSLQQAAAIIRKCNVYLGNNTGLLHMAAAWQIPCVEISCHPIDCDPKLNLSPDRFKAWGTETRVIRPEHTIDDCRGFCNKNYSHCINQITPSVVFENIKEYIS